MTRPAKYNPARRCVPWWWHWGTIRIDGEALATWRQAKVRCRRAKKGQRRMIGKRTGEVAALRSAGVAAMGK